MAAEAELHPDVPPGLHLLSAFLAMEPTDSLISLARECGSCHGCREVTESVQRFIWDHCISKKADETGYALYSKNFVKKLILEIESNNGVVLDELYEQCGYYMSWVKDGGNGNVRVCKCVSFLFPDDCFELQSRPKSGKLVVPLCCSLNMLEGDTGCSVWPSSLYLSEFVLSFPELFSDKSCFEIGSGVGLIGVCLSHVKASKVILSDGDLSTLANMQLNLELNKLSPATYSLESSGEDQTTAKESEVQCIHLPWEYAKESDLQKFMPDIILGADIIYDPSCLPHLIRVLCILLSSSTHSRRQKSIVQGSLLEGKFIDVEGFDAAEGKLLHACGLENQNGIEDGHYGAEKHRNGSSNADSKEGPVAYIATVIRNMDTFSCFLKLAEQANLKITDQTETRRPLNLLPYMQSYNRSSIRLFTVSSK